MQTEPLTIEDSVRVWCPTIVRIGPLLYVHNNLDSIRIHVYLAPEGNDWPPRCLPQTEFATFGFSSLPDDIGTAIVEWHKEFMASGDFDKTLEEAWF